MKEIRKDIKGWEWYYQISNLWRVKSLSRKLSNSKRCKWSKERILKPWLITKWYNGIVLCKNWKLHQKSIHRLVLLTFVWDSKLQVNHKNWIRTDNRLENLEFVTASENIKHSYTFLNRKSAREWKFWKDNPSSKKVIQYDLKWNFIKKWYSIADIQRQLKINSSNISSCCRWVCKTAWWFKRKYW